MLFGLQPPSWRGHSFRTAFFLTPLQPDHPSLRVTEHTRDSSQRTEARETVGISQTRELRHPGIMPGFHTAANPPIPLWERGSTPSTLTIYPLDSTKSQKILLVRHTPILKPMVLLYCSIVESMAS
jgi:hypothetical protein